MTGAPKWEVKIRAGFYLGNSPFHAKNMSLVLNLLTRHIGPQYNVAFDDDFMTVNIFNQENTHLIGTT